MSPPVQPTPAPNVELELAKLANEAMQNGADPHDATSKLHDMISYLRAFPKMAEHATNALADGVASPADITRALYPHAQGYATAQRSSVQPTTEEAASLPPDKLGVGGTIAANLANTAQGIPGVEAAEAGVRSVVRRQPYREAYRDIESATSQIPTALRVGERIAGAAPLAAVLPGSAAVSGALIGGADEALSANPDESLGTRAVKTAVGAGVGALTGKAVDMGTSAVRSLFAQNPASNLIAKQAARAASAKTLFTSALSEGRANEVSPAIHDFLAESDIAPIVEQIRAGRTGAQMDTPELLDRVYKELSDMQRTAGKPLMGADPTKPNAAVSRLANIKAAKQRFLDVVSKPTQKPPLTMDVAPEVSETAPRLVQTERPTLQGPIPGAGTTTVPFKYAGIRNPRGALRNDLSGVPDDALHEEWQRLAELNATQEGQHAGVQEAGYRGDYEALPRTEKLGHKGKEDLPDADGTVDPERLLADNKTVSDYNRAGVIRAARAKAMQRIEAEIQSRPTPPEPPDEASSFDFGQNVKPAGPAGPAFQLVGKPRRVTPGVRIETPGMRVQTAPAEDVPPLMPSYKQAVDDYRQRSDEINALKRGYDTFRSSLSSNLPAANNLTRKTPQAFAEWAKTASPEELQAARQGIQGGAKLSMRLTPNPLKSFGVVPSIAKAGKSADLLRMAPSDPQTYFDALQNLGLLTAGNQITTP